MASITIRNIPEDVHRALRVRAVQHGRSTEAEVRDILEQAAKPSGRVKVGSMLVSIARDAGALAENELTLFERDRSVAIPIRFDK